MTVGADAVSVSATLAASVDWISSVGCVALGEQAAKRTMAVIADNRLIVRMGFFIRKFNIDHSPGWDDEYCNLLLIILGNYFFLIREFILQVNDERVVIMHQ